MKKVDTLPGVIAQLDRAADYEGLALMPPWGGGNTDAGFVSIISQVLKPGKKQLEMF